MELSKLVIPWNFFPCRSIPDLTKIKCMAVGRLCGALCLLMILFTGCHTNPTYLPKDAQPKKLKKLFRSSEVFASGITGFALYDPDSDEWLFQRNSNILLTPASNAKILTLYTAMNLLGDSLVFGQILEKQDTLVLYPWGDPTFLHPDFPQNSKLINRLNSLDGQLIISNNHYKEARFGPGWAWDDFLYGFQAEKSLLPLFGNTVYYSVDQKGDIDVSPAYFASYTTINDAEDSEKCYVKRDEFSNSFEFITGVNCDPDFKASIPFNTYPYLTKELLEDTFAFEVQNRFSEEDALPEGGTVYSLPVDTVYKRLMKDSDNFVAEQLMLQVSAQILGKMDADVIIRYASKEIKQIIPDSLRWVDGSGLSRYNLVSPRSLVMVLDKMKDQFGEERLFDLFPAGGLSGTIKDYYGNEDQPFVYAKTGSMGNVHCLSGFVKADSGRILIFSFMHNHFYGSSRSHKLEMERILNYIKEEY